MEVIKDYMDDSTRDVFLSSPDVIDLTKESPVSIQFSRLRRQRNVEVPSSSNIIVQCNSSDHRKRPLLRPIVLGNTQDTQTNNSKKKRVPRATSSNEVLLLNDTIEEDDKICYTVQSDNRKSPVPHVLTCPICFESLSSNLKPITTRCGHLFCTECLQTFIRTSKKCPTCKANITLKSCTRLYF